MIERCRLVNFRKHADISVPLTRFTLLVGDNGAGKTSVLQAIHLVGQTFFKKPEEVFADERSLPSLRRQRDTGALEVELTGREGDEPWTFAISASSAELEASSYRHEHHGQKEGGPLRELAEKASQKKVPYPVQTARSAVFLHLDAAQLAAPSRSIQAVPRIEFDGYGLATVLQWILGEDRLRFQAIVEALRRVVPEFVDARIGRTERARDRVRRHTLDGQTITVPERELFIAEEVSLRFADSDWIPAHATSEGTLLALGLLTFLHTPNPPRVVLIDDLDRALHPRAQGELVGVLREVLRNAPDTQIVATSHSPYMADDFAPESVVVISRPEGGDTVARPLSQHPDQRLLEAMTTGEFLHASGAGWYWR